MKPTDSTGSNRGQAAEQVATTGIRLQQWLSEAFGDADEAA